jgi:tartrate dehydratase alpha subunit/fumarate hydratase class I-like protein
MINKVAKEALSELAEDLYQIGEVEMTRDVFRIIASIKDEPEQQKKLKKQQKGCLKSSDEKRSNRFA